MTLTAGTRLGAYEIVAPLGAGGMGEVFRAHDPRLGRDVAIKVLRAALAGNPNRLARFEREAKTLAGLSHPNIVTLFALDEADGVRFLVMELVDGLSLDRMALPGGMPLPRLLDIAIPLANGLVAAHARGVIHRDLKPANVMVTREGIVKVLDFGLAKLLGSDDPADDAPDVTRLVMEPLVADAPLSAVGQIVGTAQYTAPEQLRGEAVDARTDIFSFGILLYEMATGRRPFGGASSADVTSAILRDDPLPSSALRDDLPDDLHRIVARCLEKEPRRRFADATELANELRTLKRAMQGGRLGASTGAAPAPGAPSIAVLPFVNMSRDAEHEYFSDGVAEELLGVLAKIRGLRVAARTSAWSFKGKSATVSDIGAALGVAALLEGSVRAAGNRVRIAVQLVQVSDGYQLWSDTYDRTLDDIFAVQDDIAQRVVKELRTTLLGESADSQDSSAALAEVAHAARGRAHDAEAHRHYLQARFCIERLTREETAHGIEYLRQALVRDPRSALVWAELSRAYANEANLAWVPMAEGYARAREAAAHALALEPDLAEAHGARGWIEMLYDWDWSAARASFARGLALAPSDTVMLRRASILERTLGHFVEAIALGRRAVDLDPLSAWSHSALGRTYDLAGRAADADAAYRRALDLAPHRSGTRGYLAVVLAALGRVDEARAEAAREPHDVFRLWALALLDAPHGGAEPLRELTDRYGEAAAFQLAEIHARRGEADAAFAWLERGLAARDAGMSELEVSPHLAALHADPLWRDLLGRWGAPPVGRLREND